MHPKTEKVKKDITSLSTRHGHLGSRRARNDRNLARSTSIGTAVTLFANDTAVVNLIGFGFARVARLCLHITWKRLGVASWRLPSRNAPGYTSEALDLKPFLLPFSARLAATVQRP